MIFVYLLAPIFLLILILFGLPYAIGYYIYNIANDNTWGYKKETILYIKKKSKKVKKNDLINYNKGITRVIEADDKNAVIRNENTSELIILNIDKGIDIVKFSIPKVGIVLSLYNKLKKKVLKK